jgi:hypothetical protein
MPRYKQKAHASFRAPQIAYAGHVKFLTYTHEHDCPWDRNDVRFGSAVCRVDYWSKLRSFVRMTRPIAIYWQGEAVKSAHAEGGRGRKRDYDAFVADNVVAAKEDV